MPFSIAFSPLLSMPILVIFALCFVFIQALGFWQRRKIQWFQILAFLSIFIFALNLQIVSSKAMQKPQKLLIISDYSASIFASGRNLGVKNAHDKVLKQIGQNKNFEIIEGEIKANSPITSFSNALETARANIDESEIAGAILISDGLGIDKNELARPYPIHQILIGDMNEKDAEIELIEAPKPVQIGGISKAKIIVNTKNIAQNEIRLKIQIAQFAPYEINITPNKAQEIEFKVEKAANLPVAIEIMPILGEVSNANNAIITNIEGIADRMRVLLVTGEPYEGARAWRNLFKSNPALDLVHFTILRSPEKFDFANQDEVSLIPFPTEELFIDKLDEFDLVVFDRFQNLVGLRPEYFQNVARYVKEGGALLIALGPKDAQNKGVLSTDLREIIPINDTPKMIDGDFYPKVSELGMHHPITQNLNQNWGKWDRFFQVSTNAPILMKAGESPLLIADKVEKGRIAVILSDKSWYWQRGFDNGGPFRELVGHAAHWLMNDPKLADNIIRLTDIEDKIKIEYQSDSALSPLQVSQFQNNFSILPNANEIYQMRREIQNPQFGLYKFSAKDAAGFIIHGANSETKNTLLIADHSKIGAVLKNNGGGNYFYIGRDGNGPIAPISTIENPIFANDNGLFMRKAKNQEFVEITRNGLLPNWLYSILIIGFLILSYWDFRKKPSPKI